MKIFLLNIFKFVLILSTVMMLMLFGTLYICSFVTYEIPQEKNIIIVGDSHTECAINDYIFSRSINLSLSADAYLYSYIKLRKFLSVKKNKKKVILSFHGGSIRKSIDNWIFGERYIRNRIPKYIFMLNINEILLLMRGKAFFSSLLKLPIYHITIIVKYITKKNITYKDLYIGGYLKLDRDELQKNIEILKNTETVQEGYSLYQLEYLQNIIQLCKQYNVELILLNSPTYASEIYGNKDDLVNYYNCYFSTIKYLDFSDFNLPQYGYGDIEHLNYYGAEIFSQYLEDNYEKYF
jgi:hypothetical protein